tara:strand:+ start:63 stop:278 length:216 start_codon:yes stop_codon:yes gene_type:complete
MKIEEMECYMIVNEAGQRKWVCGELSACLKRKKDMGEMSAITAKEAETLGMGVNYAALGEDAFRLSSSRKP